MSHIETITDSAVFEASSAAVWNLLVDWAAIVDWMPDGYVQSLRMEGKGLGAIRHLVTLKGVHLSERLDVMDESSGVLELSLVGPLPWGLVSYQARGKLDPFGENRCRLTWHGTLEMLDCGPDFNSLANLLRKSYARMFLGIKREVES